MSRSSTRPAWASWSAPRSERADDGKDLRLVVTQPQILRLLELTGLDEVFTVVSSTTDAVTT